MTFEEAARIMMSGGGGAKGDSIVDLIQSSCPYFAEIPIVGDYCLRHYIIKDAQKIGLSHGQAVITYTKNDTGKVVEISENPLQTNQYDLIMSAFCKGDKILWFTTSSYTFTISKRYDENGIMIDHQYGYDFDPNDYTSSISIVTTNNLSCGVTVRGAYTWQRDFYYDGEWHHYDNTGTYSISTGVNTIVSPSVYGGWSTLTVDGAFQELKNFWKEAIKYY